jgi:hypothetical protein
VPVGAGEQRRRAARPPTGGAAPQHGLLDLAAQGHDLDLELRRQRLVVDPRRDLHPERADGQPEQDVQGRAVGARVEGAPAAGSASRVGEDVAVRGDREPADVGPDEAHLPAQHAGVLGGEQQPGLVEVDADAALGQREQVAADRAAEVERGPVVALGPRSRDLRRRRLLERLRRPPQLAAAGVLDDRPLPQERLLERERPEVRAQGPDGLGRPDPRGG